MVLRPVMTTSAGRHAGGRRIISSGSGRSHITARRTSITGHRQRSATNDQRRPQHQTFQLDHKVLHWSELLKGGPRPPVGLRSFGGSPGPVAMG